MDEEKQIAKRQVFKQTVAETRVMSMGKKRRIELNKNAGVRQLLRGVRFGSSRVRLSHENPCFQVFLQAQFFKLHL
jgi:hypothetical protein